MSLFLLLLLILMVYGKLCYGNRVVVVLPNHIKNV